MYESVVRSTVVPPPWLTHAFSAHNPLLQLLGAILFVVGVVVAILIVTFFVARALSGWLQGRMVKGGLHLNVAILLGRAIWFAIWAAGVYLILALLGIGLTPLAALIGVIGIAAGLSLQQLLQNLVAGIYLLVERPFRIGDVVAVVGPAGLNHIGKVEDIQMRTTHLRSLDDEEILVPNSAIFSGVITNRTVVGGSAVHVTATFPRQAELESARSRSLSEVRRSKGVLQHPRPEFRVTCVSKDTWTAIVTFWVESQDVATGVLWALGSAFPEATLESGNGASAS